MLAGIFDPAIRPASMEIERDLVRSFGNPKVTRTYREPGLFMAEVEPTEWQQLRRSARGNVIAWDGRLDNRGDLAGRVFSSGANADDAAVALAAYEYGGETELGKVIGDWRAVIWDRDRGTIVLANDFAGVRPLYYRVFEDRIVWSSSLAAIAGSGGVTGVPDELYAADFLLKGGSSERTPYPGILALPPGQALSFSAKGRSTKMLWSIPADEVILRRDDDYADGLRSLFEEAVKVRLRGSVPVHIELSGGLDSSSIVCMGQRLIEECRVDTRRIVAVNYRDEGSVDEKFVEAVEQRLGIESVRVETREYPFVSRDSTGGPAPAFWQKRDTWIQRHMREAGSHTLITGRFGDLIMGNFFDDSEQVADLLRQFAPGAAWTEAMAWSRVLGVPVYSILFRALTANRRGFETGQAIPQENSLTPQLLRRATEAARSVRDEWKNVPPARRKRLRMLREGLESRALATPAALDDILYTHAYAHRPLVEYMASMPPRVVCGPGQPRRLMRRAFQDLLPAAVLGRRSKASFDGVFHEALRPLAHELLRAPRGLALAERGIVDERSVRSRLERFLVGMECGHAQLRQIILLEFWLRGG